MEKKNQDMRSERDIPSDIHNKIIEALKRQHSLALQAQLHLVQLKHEEEKTKTLSKHNSQVSKLEHRIKEHVRSAEMTSEQSKHEMQALYDGMHDLSVLHEIRELQLSDEDKKDVHGRVTNLFSEIRNTSIDHKKFFSEIESARKYENQAKAHIEASKKKEVALLSHHQQALQQSKLDAERNIQKEKQERNEMITMQNKRMKYLTDEVNHFEEKLFSAKDKHQTLEAEFETHRQFLEKEKKDHLSSMNRLNYYEERDEQNKILLFNTEAEHMKVLQATKEGLRSLAETESLAGLKAVENMHQAKIEERQHKHEKYLLKLKKKHENKLKEANAELEVAKAQHRKEIEKHLNAAKEKHDN
eukprot:g3758.t1